MLNLNKIRDSAVDKLYQASELHGRAELMIHEATQNPATDSKFFAKRDITKIRKLLTDSDKLRDAAISELALE
jgi:hypothetical protein